ncbi:MAG: hypothetical protein WCC27_11975 [Acidobacteriaceae bacterium]
MRLTWGIVIGLMMGVATAYSQAQQPEAPIQVSLCEIKTHPEKYLKKLVEFTASASHGFEDSMAEDSRCPWPDRGPGVWMEYGGNRSTDTMYCCGFSPKPTRDKPLVVDGIPLSLVDDEKFQEFDARLHPKHSKQQRMSDTVKATLRGRVFGRYEGIAGTQQSPAWRGYGHMGCCMLFVVTQVVSVDAKR